MNAMDPLRQLAQSTEESAVREKFDLHNAKYGRILSYFLIPFSFGWSIAYVSDLAIFQFRAAGALLMLGGAVVLYLLSSGRSRSLRRLAGTSISFWIVGLLIVEYLGLLLIAIGWGDDDTAVFGSVIPWILVIFWMTFARRTIVHSICALMMILAVETSGGVQERAEIYGPSISSSVLALLVGGLITRRHRRGIVTEWSERHAQAVEQLRMRDELELARKVQLSMLPEGPPSLPWLDVAASSVPATEVGGDYYDYFPFGDHVAIVCGDVAGHGFASGIVLATLRSGFTLLRESLHDPAKVLTRLHELIEQTSRTRMLTTAAVVSIDWQSRRARIASAGHPPVMFRSNGSVRSIELFGPPLGVRLPINIAQTEISLQSGDLLVLHSDGVYETTNATGELYGLDRLAAVIERSTGSATEVLAAITEDVKTFRGNQPQSDDVTAVVAVVN